MKNSYHVISSAVLLSFPVHTGASPAMPPHQPPVPVNTTTSGISSGAIFPSMSLLHSENSTILGEQSASLLGAAQLSMGSKRQAGEISFMFSGASFEPSRMSISPYNSHQAQQGFRKVLQTAGHPVKRGGGSASMESTSMESTSMESTSMESTSKESTSKESTSKESTSKESSSMHSQHQESTTHEKSKTTATSTSQTSATQAHTSTNGTAMHGGTTHFVSTNPAMFESAAYIAVICELVMRLVGLSEKSSNATTWTPTDETYGSQPHGAHHGNAGSDEGWQTFPSQKSSSFGTSSTHTTQTYLSPTSSSSGTSSTYKTKRTDDWQTGSSASPPGFIPASSCKWVCS